MRTVREFAAAGVAGVHIEDQLFPKRAHYHGYQVHAIPRDEFVAKIKYACLQRDETDPDFLVLDANPLENITNTQRISGVFIKGVELDRAALRPSLTRALSR